MKGLSLPEPLTTISCGLSARPHNLTYLPIFGQRFFLGFYRKSLLTWNQFVKVENARDSSTGINPQEAPMGTMLSKVGKPLNSEKLGEFLLANAKALIQADSIFAFAVLPETLG